MNIESRNSDSRHTSSLGLLFDNDLDNRVASLLESDQPARQIAPHPALSRAIGSGQCSVGEIFDTLASEYGDRAVMGRRSYDVERDSHGQAVRTLLPSFTTLTYRELAEQVHALSAYWSGAFNLGSDDVVATLGFASPDYLVVDISSFYLGAVSVPLQASMSVSQIGAIIDETKPRILAVSNEYLDHAVDVLNRPGGEIPERVVVFDHDGRVDDDVDRLARARQSLAETQPRIVVEVLADALDRGREHDTPSPVGLDDNPMALLIYTSGSTGSPKGAIYTRSMAARQWYTYRFPAISVNFMPLSHVAGRMILLSTVASGGTAHFVARSDLSTLFEDMALIRPTVGFLVPRVCDMIYARYESELRRGNVEEGSAAAQAISDDIRDNLLGGRMIWAMSGSAPISPKVRDFMSSCLGLELYDGYGSTEAGMVFGNGIVARPPVIDYKLVDVPELGYYTTDKPHPRGELLVKSEHLFPGYYNRPDATASVFDEAGYYKTGDIMVEIEPDHIEYIDRRSNVIKLSQGEFVAISHLEAIYAASPLVHQIFLYGNSSRSNVVGVVVPNSELVERHLSGEDIRGEILASLQDIATTQALNAYEVPQAIAVETEPFSKENGLLSGIGKLLRPTLKEYYAATLENLYVDMDAGRERALVDLSCGASDRPTIDTVIGAAAATLGCPSDELRPESRFSDLGGDSLAALSFSNLIADVFAIDAPVGLIMSAASDLATVAAHIDAELAGSSSRPTLTGVHGPSPTEISADHITPEALISSDVLASAASAAPVSEQVTTVLLTGANGYLGRFLCLEWLERVGPRGRVICVIRGNDNDSARARLDEAFGTVDVQLRDHYRELAEDRLEVLAGDIGEPHFGLDDQTWRRLAHDVDAIVHPAALVNHVLPYSQLFVPNVLGTAEVATLALTDRLKPVTYLSTVGVAVAGDPSALLEDNDIRITSARRPIDDSYANGYGNSKWAGEVLLRNLSDRFNLPVSVFRSDMILAHRSYRGQVNVPDMFTRLIFSLVVTGVAPASFYQLNNGQRAESHYDGIPADFTAAAITELAQREGPNYRTYNVVNPHEDGISLDTVVDWLIDAGNSIERLDDFDQWREQFTASLRSLPDEIGRRYSSLPLMHAFTVPSEPERGAAVPSERFEEEVRRNGIGSDSDIPHITADLIAKYVGDLKDLGILTPDRVVGAVRR